MAIHLFVGQSLAYNNPPLSVGTAISHIVMIGIFFFFATFIVMVLNYIQEINNKLRLSNLSNVEMLNGMHEGVMILSKEDTEKAKLLFVNHTARKLIKQFLQTPLNSLASVLRKESFKFVSLTDRARVDHNLEGPRCLEQIITTQRDEPS